MVKTHTDREYENELNAVRTRLSEMAGRVEIMLTDSVKSFIDADKKLARQTIEMDRRVNRDELELDELCLLVVAKRQPLGLDLRFITIALKMVMDLERVGDLAVNICERVIKLGSSSKKLKAAKIQEMSTAVAIMLRTSMEAFLNADVELAESVLKKDDAVDEMYQDTMRELLGKMQSTGGDIESLMHVQAIAKWIERVGDHCTNIAELVVFMVKGEDIRHMGKLDQRLMDRIDSILPTDD